MVKAVHIIGAGLAGSEATWQCVSRGVPVILHEMRPDRMTEAHQGSGFAELVCSNSFRSDDALGNAVGLLHEEMRRAGSLVMGMGDMTKLPAGGALAVDREAFSEAITTILQQHPLVTIEYGEVKGLPPKEWGNTIIATGPLTAPALAQDILQTTGEDSLAFFDAIAPIVYKDSINFDIAWMQSRYDKKGPGGDGADYINCPLDKEQYETFIEALVSSEQTEFKDFEKDTPYFESCLPIEVMASRGAETLRWGPMKPVGLTNPHNPTVKAHAIVQLRQDNALGTLYNMVGFQTKMKYGAQTEILKTIPGLEKAVFARLGGIHRNTFINSPKLLNDQLQLKVRPDLRFAGQIMGVEGYVESSALGLIAGRLAAAQALGQTDIKPPRTTALGALMEHVTGGFMDGPKAKFQPMNVNFGLFPPMEEEIIYKSPDGKRLRGKDKTRHRKGLMAKRALRDINVWVKDGLAS
ncbi:methylenetetrahydrofolate--tRNA-(uracil-5-)-methyltransferase [Litorimonas taeanensis]|uniref:Methylenetetrahydrofolate--tRNA-(uracil-5-)-methyltransferase TrmFO n=1 Tax=Litorimonas taeanensis TaxID=568099 RepID=A0A420WKW0_9PROT|nr:methylenetetrahydrofolate--tRNA-(uracil(54)-C(5))-methyltransferase (FADH(2)-oxidizing) TrmFO [Litorimonas taeanensis]RKQ71525.1 methylenetetrahydrofolate--tRNA-(uracil-5-)-methyltransferase [Litorimonas taeanensis]